MTPIQALEKAADLGLKLGSEHGDTLTYQPAGRCPLDFAETLKANKCYLLVLLRLPFAMDVTADLIVVGCWRRERFYSTTRSAIVTPASDTKSSFQKLMPTKHAALLKQRRSSDFVSSAKRRQPLP